MAKVERKPPAVKEQPDERQANIELDLEEPIQKILKSDRKTKAL